MSASTQTLSVGDLPAFTHSLSPSQGGTSIKAIEDARAIAPLVEMVALMRAQGVSRATIKLCVDLPDDTIDAILDRTIGA